MPLLKERQQVMFLELRLDFKYPAIDIDWFKAPVQAQRSGKT